MPVTLPGLRSLQHVFYMTIANNEKSIMTPSSGKIGRNVICLCKAMAKKHQWGRLHFKYHASPTIPGITSLQSTLSL